jgi:hypothetical protein
MSVWFWILVLVKRHVSDILLTMHYIIIVGGYLHHIFFLNISQTAQLSGIVLRIHNEIVISSISSV